MAGAILFRIMSLHGTVGRRARTLSIPEVVELGLAADALRNLRRLWN